jgi:hypothetical protein
MRAKLYSHRVDLSRTTGPLAAFWNRTQVGVTSLRLASNTKRCEIYVSTWRRSAVK